MRFCPSRDRSAPWRCWIALALMPVWMVSAQAASPAMAGAVSAYQRGDYTTAYRLFRPLAAAGSARAQAIVGLMLWYGEGTPRDRHAATDWYRRAARQGYPPAQFNLALALLAGDSDGGGRQAAVAWLERAAAGGHLPSLKRLQKLDVPAYVRARERLRSRDASRPPAPEARPRTAAETPARPPAGAPVARFAVQLMSARSGAMVTRAAERYRARYPGLLAGLEASVTPADLGAEKGRWHRLRFGPLPSLDAARQLCAGLIGDEGAGPAVRCLAVRVPAGGAGDPDRSVDPDQGRR